MAVNQVIYGGETLVDLTGDNVTPETLLEGVTAHGANGERITGTLSVQSIVDAVLAQVLENDKKKYPVGYVWISASSTNPANILGFGTWEQIKDRFLLAAGSSYSAGSTGGSATHTLTVDEMPSHDHGAKGWAAVVDGSGSYRTLGAQGSSDVYTTRTRGGGKAHNNMPPYLAVYVWKRTA